MKPVCPIFGNVCQGIWGSSRERVTPPRSNVLLTFRNRSALIIESWGGTMIGQWIAETDDGTPASIRIDLEDRGRGCVGHAYVFYPGENLPGFLFEIRLPVEPPFKTRVLTTYLYTSGGVMTVADRQAAEARLVETMGQAPPPSIDAEFIMDGANLRIQWSVGDEPQESVVFIKSDTSTPSELTSRADLTTWDEFRQWAVRQRPRNFIFRGQQQPYKLVSTFHRTWRKDVRTWIIDDVSQLFGVVAEKLNYPLQIGNLQHNAAIWSILQHHGYPTPMLDWTFSPFVAAYFAFQDAQPDQDTPPRIYIFDQAAWNDRYGKLHFYVDAAPDQLVVVESMPVANPRHGPQQALSTVTNIADVEGFIRRREQQDGVVYLTACDLPVDSKPQIMRELELMGITYGSLFPGLDGICRDMRDRLFAPPV